MNNDNYLSNAGRLDWPTETAIDNAGLNGEAGAPTYSIGDTFYRINPNGRYALYYNGKSWRESATVTNDMLTGDVE